MAASLFLLDVKDGDHVSFFQQEVTRSCMEDGFTGGGINLLGHFILQVLDNNLREEKVGEDGRGGEWKERKQKDEGREKAMGNQYS